MQKNCTINVENSINSGQAFLWKKTGDYWYGINGQDILRVDKNGVVDSFQNSKIDFFRKNDNLDEIIKSISKDKTVRKAVKQYSGLRILRQDPFQCLISLIDAMASFSAFGNKKNSSFSYVVLTPNFLDSFSKFVLIFCMLEFDDTINEIKH